MPGVIDQLVVILGLDPKAFTAGAREAKAANKDLREDLGKTAVAANRGAESAGKANKNLKDDAAKTSRQMEAEGRRAGEGFFGNLKSEALGLFAVLVGANSLKDFVASTVTGISDMSRQAKAAGMNISDMAAFGNIIEANGGKAEAARASLSSLAAVLENWRTLGIIDQSHLLGFARIGANPNDDPMAVFLKFAKWAEGKDPRLVAQEGNLLGFDEASVNEAMKGQIRVLNDLAEARQRGLPTEADAEKLRALQASFKGLSQQITAAGRALLVDFAPALIAVMNDISADLGGNPDGTNPGHGNLLGALGALFSGIWHLATGKGPLKDRVQPGDLGYHGPGARGPYDGARPDDELTRRGFTLIPGLGYVPTPPGASTPGGGGGSAVPAGGAAGKLAAALQGAGFTAQQAAGVAAWSYAESGFRTGAFNSAGGGQGAFGIGQWRGSRLRALRAKYGANPTLDQQIAFLVSELGGPEAGAASAIRGADSAQGALWATITKFGRGSPSDNLGDFRRGTRFLTHPPAGLTGGATVVNIGQVNVNAPNARDANGVARAIAPALKSAIPAQANSGLSG